MALKIRLSRGGAKKHPFYRMIVTDSRNPRDSAFLEKLGTYDPFLPHENTNRFVINEERVKHWLSVGATPSNRAAILLSGKDLCKKPEIHETPKKSAPKKKAQERMKEQSAAASE